MSIISTLDFYPDENVRTNPQRLSERQKEQARQNIGAMAADTKIPDNLTASFAPMISASDTGEVVATDIVAEAPHRISCRIIGAADPTAVTVSRYGKNLLDPKAYTGKTGVFIQSDREIQLNAAAGYLPIGRFTSQTGVVVSCEKLSNKDPRLTTFYLKLKYEDGSVSPTTVVENGASFQVQSDPQKILIGINAPGSNIGQINNNHFNGLMVSVSGGAYVPFSEPQTARASPDGTVSGLTSIAPSMTLMTDTPGVTMQVGYNADTKGYIDREIAEIQKAMLGTVKGGTNDV